MKRQIDFSKIVYVFFLMGFTLHIFVLDLKIQNLSLNGVENSFYSFYLILWMSMDEFDIAWIILGIFIYYFYYHTYFLKDGMNKKKLCIIIISIIFTIFLLVGISLYNYNNLDMIFSSYVQGYKCFMVGFGYYFMIYAILKKIFYKKYKRLECDTYE